MINNNSFFIPKLINNEDDNKSIKIDYFTHRDNENIQFTFAGHSTVLKAQARGKSKKTYTLQFADESTKVTIFLAIHWLRATPSLLRYLPANCFQWPTITDLRGKEHNHNNKS